MKIKSIKINHFDTPKKYYDVINANPWNNFLVKTNTGYIISHNCFEDEISFLPNQDVEKQKQKASDLVNTVTTRMQSRFMHGDKNPTIFVLASSKRTEQSFMETFIENKRKNESKTTWVVDEPQWVIRTDKDSEKKFKVAIGNKFLDSEVLPLNVSEEDLKIYRDKGFKILDVPIGYYENFIDDIDIALTDIAGISTSNVTRYIAGPRLAKIKVDTYQNLFTKEIIEVGDGEDDKAQYYDFIDMERLDRSFLERPMFIHLDLSESGDKTGIAGVWIVGKKPHQEGVPDSKELYYRLAFSVSVKAPKGHSISFEKNRQFIYWLREQGFAIKGISTDTFQSFDTGQMLKSKGFNYETISVDRIDADRICKPYLTLKNAIYEERLQMYQNKFLTEELIGLERNNNGKIDHGPSGINSKDSADALCLHPDTEIFLLSGKHKTIKELYENHEDEWVLGYNTETSKLEPLKIQDVINNGFKSNLIKLTLDNGEKLICTDDHKILLRDGNYIEAKDTLNKSLMPFTYEDKIMYGNRDYTYVYNPNKDLTASGIYLHKLVAESLYSDIKQEKTLSKGEKEWVVIHHINCDRKDNSPCNLEYLTNVEHSKKHTSLNQSEKKRHQISEANRKQLEQGVHPFQLMSKEQRAANGRKSLIKLNKSEKHREAVRQNNKKLAAEGRLSFQLHKEASRTPSANLKRDNTCMERYGGTGFKSSVIQQKCRESCLANNGYDNPRHSKEKQYEMQLNKAKNAWIKICNYLSIDPTDSISMLDFKCACYALNISCSVDKLISIGVSIDTTGFDMKEYKKLRAEGNCVRMFLKDLQIESFTYKEFSDYYDKRCEVDKEFRYRFHNKPTYEDIMKLGFKLYNHRVVKIEEVSGSEVYDIKLDKVHNFALTSGIFVHNCGSIYNASQHAEEFAFEYGETLDTIVEVGNSASLMDRQQIQIDFEKELEKALDPLQGKVEEIKKTDEQVFRDFGMGRATRVDPLYLSNGILI